MNLEPGVNGSFDDRSRGESKSTKIFTVVRVAAFLKGRPLRSFDSRVRYGREKRSARVAGERGRTALG